MTDISFDQEMNELRVWFQERGLDVRKLRRFAVQESEIRDFVTKYSDQPVPRPGFECEIYGLNCLIVPDHDGQPE